MGFPGLDKLIAASKAAITEAETRKLFRGFEFETTKTKWKMYEEWQASHKVGIEDLGPEGGQYSFEITPTSVGSMVVVRDNITKDTFELNDWALFG